MPESDISLTGKLFEKVSSEVLIKEEPKSPLLKPNGKLAGAA